MPVPHVTAAKLRLFPLIAATYFMVSGGPYGIEEILGGAGFRNAILILALLPLVWSLPTALMIGELASAMPEDGGFYVWVRRGLGEFWGYQEGWLSLAASVFDMAIYPSLFTLYLGKLMPALTAGPREFWWKLAVVALCCAWNLRGASSVGDGSTWFFALLLSPFAIFVALGIWRGVAAHPAVNWDGTAGEGFKAAMLVALWNYMGWDNASTVAKEVENPQRNYPRAMVGSAVLVAVSYILPLLAMAYAGLPAAMLNDTGDWVPVTAAVGGHWLGVAIVAGGALTGIGMFNALVMSYSRVPMAMAEAGWFPRVLARTNARGVPWVNVLACGAAWALALQLPFDRLISIDLVLYGGSLMLEFVALVALRVREPQMTRPFRAGNFFMACLLGVGPLALIVYAAWSSRAETIGGHFSALLFAALIAMVGPAQYWLLKSLRSAAPR